MVKQSSHELGDIRGADGSIEATELPFMRSTAWPGDGFQRTILRKYDMATGASLIHDFGASKMPGECVIAPRPLANSEDDAWAMLFVYDKSRDASDFVILDAQRFDGEPVATVRLPGRVPFGLHGAWLPDAASSDNPRTSPRTAGER